jgi:hypothetical protein
MSCPPQRGVRQVRPGLKNRRPELKVRRGRTIPGIPGIPVTRYEEP